MKSMKIILAVSGLLLFSACSSGGGGGGGGGGGYTCDALTSDSINPLSKIIHPTSATNNQMSVSVGCGYINEPCVSVTICVPGTSTCQTIDNILLDTGSFGLRVFNCATSLSLPAQTNSQGTAVAECVGYGDGSHDWGPVAIADVTMGGETASSVPIQIINPSYGSVPDACNSDLDYSPAVAGFNGIMGVGLGTSDCGSSCVGNGNANNGSYFACSGSGCVGTALAINKQVTNPVSMLTTDNNGVVLTLSSVGSSGSSSATGTLTLGVNTETNNQASSSYTAYSAAPDASDGNYSFTTTFQSTPYTTSFVDSGSNGLFFPAPGTLPACSDSSAAPGFMCPSGDPGFSTTVQGQGTLTPSGTVTFNIGNASDLVNSGNMAFNNLGASASGLFDWGLPFFLGRTVFVLFDGSTAPNVTTTNVTNSTVTGPAWFF